MTNVASDLNWGEKRIQIAPSLIVPPWQLCRLLRKPKNTEVAVDDFEYKSSVFPLKYQQTTVGEYVCVFVNQLRAELQPQQVVDECTLLEIQKFTGAVCFKCGKFDQEADEDGSSSDICNDPQHTHPRDVWVHKLCLSASDDGEWTCPRQTPCCIVCDGVIASREHKNICKACGLAWHKKCDKPERFEALLRPKELRRSGTAKRGRR